MLVVKKQVRAAVVLLLTVSAAGCMRGYSGQPDAVGPLPQPQDVSEKRFDDPQLHGRTAVESALELSEKYAELSDQVAILREKNQNLVAENTRLNEEVSKVQAELDQTKKELNEANALLIEMLGELNTWKNNVLGFRDEMRQAAKAQLEALLKILETLSGEERTGLSEDSPPTGLAEGIAGEPEASTSELEGERNE